MKIAILCQLWPQVLQDLQQRYDCVVAVNPERDDEVAACCRGRGCGPAVLSRWTGKRWNTHRVCGWWCVPVRVSITSIEAVWRGIHTVCVPLSAQSVAEHTIGLILRMYRNIPWLHQSLGQGRWEKRRRYGRELAGKTLGLLGFGRIGICTARLAKAFGMPLFTHDRSPAKPHKQQAADELGVAFVALRDLFAGSDIVAIQIPLDVDHRGMVGRELLGLMKADAVLVNVGRGPLVDEAALYEALRDGKLLGAACDVFVDTAATARS